MKPIYVKYYFKLINFSNEVIGCWENKYTRPESAITRGGKLLWLFPKAARVLISSENGFHVTIEWGLRERY